MPTNIDALYKMPTHASKKVKWWSTGSGIKRSPKIIYKKMALSEARAPPFCRGNWQGDAFGSSRLI